MKRTNWTVLENDHGIRPAGKDDECFYCHQKVGQEHKPDCVTRCRTVVVEFAFRITRAVPEHWDAKHIEFHMNEGSWCTSNILCELEALDNRLGCLCWEAEGKFLREATEEDEERHKMHIADYPFNHGHYPDVDEEVQ